MTYNPEYAFSLSPMQQSIRDRCNHPSGKFAKFPVADVETSIPARFEKIVRKHASRIAVTTETSAVTYNQLNDMANRFAHVLLQTQGAKAQPIALLLEKDVAQVAAMLGTMKAGKFFLILDPSFPKTRLATMLKGSRAKLVVTNRRNASLADEIIARDCDLIQWETVDGSTSSENPELPIAPKALAFINYTSGSTGEPKGLLRTHRMILHNIMLRTNLVHVCQHDRISLLSSGTSNAITNSLLALLNGAGLYSLEIKTEGVARLGSWLEQEAITIAPMSSPLFRNLCETLKGNHNFPELRILRLRSESVFKSDLDLYKRFFSPKCIFVTGLSSNETGPLADYLVGHDTVVTDGSVPVGYAAPGKEILLLNEDGETIGFDEVGEIAVRSRYLFPGYLRNPRLTKSKFKHDPTGNGSRIYLTGDMGLRLADGCLLHKGRKDFRVKVRGYPVDLKEVETAFRAHPSMLDSVVTARTNQLGETALVAYFVTATRRAPSISELIRFLGQTIPDYMIPAKFVRLERMPLNPQNKVDRTALPPAAETRPPLDTPFMAPRDEIERRVAEIWAEVIGIDQVGVHDNFFELGGHSLGATRVVARVIDKFHIEIPLQALFESPTVERMAAVIKENQSRDHQPRERRSLQSTDVTRARTTVPTIDFTPFPKDDVERSIPERFEKIVRMYPDRIALKTGNEIVTYAQLNAMANRMAHAIVERRGLEAEAVAILLDQGAPLMAAMLAVLKVGKFFVWLDRYSPKARLATVIRDSQAGLIISDRQYSEFTRHFHDENSILLASDSINSHVAQENLNLNISSNSLAAISYTSGSTGEPKGVILAHRNLLHQAMLFTNAYKISACDRLLLTTSSTANALSIGFSALLNGAALLPFDVQNYGVNRLVNWLLDEKISICWIGAPLFRNICQALSAEKQFPHVRILRLASEASYKSDLELYEQHFSPSCLLINGLSNTETGLVCLYPVDFNAEITDQEVPVGYPVEDKEVILLDDVGNEVGPSEIGEIAIRSCYLSPGYWRSPELTATKFKPDPNGGDQRIYLSGDLGLMRPDGCLIHKGRKDFRAKIRGYGVEPAEIEKVLNSHEAIGQAVVVARAKQSGEPRLVAYYTRAELPVPTVSELRAFLTTQFPDFMIPSTFVMLDAIPVTPNGKIDRRGLPEPENVRPDLATAYVASQTEIEQKLVSIWQDVLDVRPIGVNDRFYDLGGDSLSVSRVISQVIEQFEVEIPLQSIFQSPTIADMAAVIALHQKTLPRDDQPADIAASTGLHELQSDTFPLSFSQQRLWFLDQLDPCSFTYNLFSAYRLKGEINVAALEQSFNEILRRHKVLRTVFRSEGGNPVQVVLPNLTIKIPVSDLRATVSRDDRWAKARRMFTEEAQRPFDLASGPLLRITLLQLTDDEYVLLRAMHHIVFDGWSASVLFRELSELYAALSTGQPSPLADLPVQYADFAKWQRQWFQGERLESQLSYWKKQLENIAALQLPTDRHRQPLQTTRGARRHFALSPRLSFELTHLSHQHGATLFMTLLAAFQTLLHRYSGQTDIVIGSPVAGRSRKEFEELIGFFLNTLVLRLDLSGNPTFIETIRRAREVCLQALSHQELPFEKLVEELHPDRNLGSNPLFQVTFAFQNSPRTTPRFSNIKMDELEVETGIARFDLHLFMEEIDGHLKGYCDYNTDLYDASTIERMVGHFQTLLDGIVANPDQPISELPLLAEAEKHQLLVEWNDTGTDYPNDNCIHQLFEEQVERTPAAVAVVFEDQKVTYRELNNRANQLAHYLVKLGVGPEVLVGLCLERSIDMIVGLLAILKAGGAYLPLDPDEPKDRLFLMLEDAQPRVLLTQETLFSSFEQLNPVCLVRDWQEIAKQSTENPHQAVSAQNLAYVIYTSGSTGKPKGVMIPHRGLVNYLTWATKRYEAARGIGSPVHSPIGFDLTITSLFTPLLTGRKVVLLSEDRAAESLSSVLHRQTDFSLIKITPAHLEVLSNGIPIGKLASCTRTIVIGGEALTFEKLADWSKHAPRVRLINEYGPTETVVGCCVYEIAPGHSPSGPVPIGGPIANTQIYILDSNLQPVPIGVSGELHIGGVGLARGYLNRPELTAEEFIVNPFSNEPGARLYRTGDLARWLPDGNIEFLGRIDNQVKIRGYRIELGEIEAVLAQHSSIQQAVVLAREDTPGDKRLAAYVVTGSGSAPSVQDLRNYLQQKLPDYMVPSVFMFLDSLPITPNGKLDRKALPAPDPSRPELEDTFAAPHTPVEELVANIWCEILKLDRVGIHDNFFHLGGHSLLATQVVSRIREVLKIELPLRTLFESPTIQGLTQRLHHFTDKQEVTKPTQIAPVPREQYRVQTTRPTT
jgi:amino acid adenylation domain-containing protein